MSLPGSSQSRPSDQPLDASEESLAEDWRFCQDALFQVSRTFSQPIELLPDEQQKALTTGYLLCRVVDTLEDCEGIEVEERDSLYGLFHDVLRGQRDPAEFSRSFIDLPAKAAELKLIRGLARVMRVFQSQTQSTQTITLRWVSEMADGMRLYSRRAEHNSFHAVYSLADLERYCYFVAGTVGHLITELFEATVEQPGLEPRLREHCESFGLGLQMVNIVKDVTDDHARGVCYVPRQMCRAEGFEPEQLLDGQHRAAALRVIERMTQRAGEHLDRALEYTLNIPADHPQLRLFCLLPLWMAMHTLTLARNNEDVLIPGRPVKITREIVLGVIAECGRICQDDAALRRRYQQVRSED